MKKKDLLRKSIYAAAALMVLPFISCNDDRIQTEGPDGEEVEVNLTINTKAPTGDPESQIRSLRVYAFQESRMVKYYKADIPADQLGDVHQFKMKLKADVTNFYIIANEKGAGQLKLDNSEVYTLPDNVASDMPEADFAKITFSSLPTKESIAKNGIPMSGKQTETITKETTSVTLGISRAIAKLNLYFAKKGTGEVYMSRGSYLYNVPQFGYLFANTSYNGNYNHIEGSGDQSDSPEFQKNGQVIIPSGRSIKDNPLTKTIETRDQINQPANYDQIPADAIYLFANPNTVDKKNTNNPVQSASKGYYMKFVRYQSYLDNRGQEVTEYPEPTYICFPAVKPNDNLQLFAHISIYGHVDISFNWMVAGWIPAGGDIEFN